MKEMIARSRYVNVFVQPEIYPPNRHDEKIHDAPVSASILNAVEEENNFSAPSMKNLKDEADI